MPYFRKLPNLAKGGIVKILDLRLYVKNVFTTNIRG